MAENGTPGAYVECKTGAQSVCTHERCGYTPWSAAYDEPDNVHHIERPEDYLSPDLLRFLADEKAEEATPHCATCRCGEEVACGIDGCERDGFDDPPRCSFHRVSDIDWDDA